MIHMNEILQTIQMIDQQNLDIRTITMGISLRDCADPDIGACSRKIYDKVTQGWLKTSSKPVTRSRVSSASLSSISVFL